MVRGLTACLTPAQLSPLSLAGHAADVLGDTLYVAGGGNNTSGCTDLVSLDLSPLSQANGEAKPLRWTVVAQSEARAPTASEGLSLVTSPSSRRVAVGSKYPCPTNCQWEPETSEFITFYLPGFQKAPEGRLKPLSNQSWAWSIRQHAALQCTLTLWA